MITCGQVSFLFEFGHVPNYKHLINQWFLPFRSTYFCTATFPLQQCLETKNLEKLDSKIRFSNSVTKIAARQVTLF